MLGEMLREKIEASGIPAAVIARRTGIGRTTLWVLERGENPKTGKPSRPSQDKLERLAQVLGLDPDERVKLLQLAGYSTRQGFRFASPVPVTSKSRVDLLRDILRRTQEIQDIVEDLLDAEVNHK